MKAQVLCKSLLAVMVAIPHLSLGIITTLNRNDPVPPYTADNPFALLGTNQYEFLKGRTKDYEKQHFALEIMPFYQRASRGASACGCDTELGNILGYWNMIALLPYNTRHVSGSSVTYIDTNEDLPCGHTHPAILESIRDQLLENINDLIGTTHVPEQLQTVQGLLEVQSSTTTNQGLACGLVSTMTPTVAYTGFGLFTVPMKYKKQGVRFNGQLYIGKGFGVDAQTGFADIRQCAGFIDGTPGCKDDNPFKSSTYVTDTKWGQVCQYVSMDLMSQLEQIVTNSQINKSICEYHASSIEDVYAEIFWRLPIQANRDIVEEQYPRFLFIPFLAVGGSFGVAKNPDPCFLLGVPFGNQCHNAARFRAGLSLDFYDTVQLNFEAGGMFFDTRRFCNYPMPTNEFQYPIYPQSTNVCIKPGDNWHMVIGFNAQNFFDNFSFTFNYIFANHQKDCITLLEDNTAAGPVGDESEERKTIHPFKPCSLICKSEWSVQVFDAALNYAISPNVRLGLMMQIPFKRKNAYRSSTFLGSVFMSF